MASRDVSYLEDTLTRRSLLKRGAQAGALLTGFSGLAAACGGSGSGASQGTSPSQGTSTAELTGTLYFNTYPGWIGKHEYQRFQALHPQVKIVEKSTGVGSVSSIVQQIQRDPNAYDFLLLGLAGLPQLQASGLVADLDWAKIPNIKNIPDRFRTAYTLGIPTDYGKSGFGYRKDLVSERPTSWADFWALAPKYSGKVVMEAVAEDTIGNTLKMLGYSGNSVDPSELDQAKQKLLEIKPHLQAFLASDIAKSLVTGASVLTNSWDFDIALAQQKEPNIEWVLPDEGCMAYLEGWVAVKNTQHLDTVQAFFDFHLAPPNYADFVNSTGTAYLMPAATPLIDSSISDNPILSFDPETLPKVEFGTFHGEATKQWNQIWAEVQAA